MKFEGRDHEWLVVEKIKIPAVFPLSFSKDKQRLYALPGGVHATAAWIYANRCVILRAFKTHRPKVCEFHR